ncbi:MAG: DNA repair protein RecO [Gammaproteobacteria bacterium]|nr:DNA repair protein RecO [Gammaproteobacteria bacterium]
MIEALKPPRDKTANKSVDRADKERVYLLHRRPFSETSIIGYFFTRSYGVVHVLARGAKRKRGSYSLLQPTMELLMSWSGRSDLKTMRSVECNCRHNIYSGKGLTILFYLNELLYKLLKPFDPHPDLYDKFHDFMLAESHESFEGNLRKFELELFAAVGYAVSIDSDYKSLEPLVSDGNYVYDPINGFTISEADDPVNSFSGADLLKIKQGDYADPQIRYAAKSLSRQIIHHLLDSRRLSSRGLVIRSIHPDANVL